MINLCVRESGLGEFGKRMWQSYEDWGELTYNADIKARSVKYIAILGGQNDG